ncbi:MAG: phosphoribosylformylglycinamidine synthase subunit PurQ [Phycisphaerales bacterium]
MPSALVIRAPGTNCDSEMCRAFAAAGATPELVPLDRLLNTPALVERHDLIGFPGGFSYGDDVASGRIFALRLREHLYPALRAAAQRGVPMIGACNGFQVMVQAGLLPGPADGHWQETPPAQETSLTFNAGGRFIDRWVRVAPVPETVCIWTRRLSETFAGFPDSMMLPIGHGEGRFVADSPATLARLKAHGQIALRYAPDDNPNGSTDDIAGICDPSGRIFALMPHPERYLEWTRHPFWTRFEPHTLRGPTPGLTMFTNAVASVQHAPV